MNFEDLQSAWAAQETPSSSKAEIESIRLGFLPELRRRGRMLAFTLGCLVIGLLLNPLLFLANLEQVDPTSLPSRWINLLLAEGIVGLLLIHVHRQRRRHRHRLLSRGEDLHAVIVTASESVEAEMADHRKLVWILPATLFTALFSIALNHPVAVYGWEPLLLRLALIASVLGPVCLVFFRHYRKVLRPEWERLQALLAEWR